MSDISLLIRFLEVLPDPAWTSLSNATTGAAAHGGPTNTNSTVYGDFIQRGDDELTLSPKAYLICWMLLLLLCLLASPTLPDDEHRRRASELGQHNAEAVRIQRFKDPKVRQKVVERSIAIKRVVAADADGNLTLGELQQQKHEEEVPDNFDETNKENCSFSNNPDAWMDENEDVSTCVICLEPFRVGDAVAWSRPRRPGVATPGEDSNKSNNKSIQKIVDEAECLHVFHYDCILPWLLDAKHDDCPSCRTVILQYDQDKDISGEYDEHERDEDASLEEELGDNPSSGAADLFVIMHGLVARVRRASYSLTGQTGSGRPVDAPSDIDTATDMELAIPYAEQRLSNLSARYSINKVLSPCSSSSVRLRRRFSAFRPIRPGRLRRVSSAEPCGENQLFVTTTTTTAAAAARNQNQHPFRRQYARSRTSADQSEEDDLDIEVMINEPSTPLPLETSQLVGKGGEGIEVDEEEEEDGMIV